MHFRVVWLRVKHRVPKDPQILVPINFMVDVILIHDPNRRLGDISEPTDDPAVTDT